MLISRCESRPAPLLLPLPASRHVPVPANESGIEPSIRNRFPQVARRFLPFYRCGNARPFFISLRSAGVRARAREISRATSNIPVTRLNSRRMQFVLDAAPRARRWLERILNKTIECIVRERSCETVAGGRRANGGNEDCHAIGNQWKAENRKWIKTFQFTFGNRIRSEGSTRDSASISMARETLLGDTPLRKEAVIKSRDTRVSARVSLERK